jgi:hypothetical protein
MFATPITLGYGQLNNPKIQKFNFLKCPSDDDKNFEYFTYLVMKNLNIKYKHLYKQPPSTSNPFGINVFFLISEIRSLGDYFDVIFHPLYASKL